MQIHPTAVVDPSAQVGDGCEIGPGAVIEADVVLGANNRVGPHAFLGRHTKVGDGNEFHVGAVVGHEPQDLKFDRSIRSFCRVGNGNVFREYCVIHRSSQPEGATEIGNHNYVMNHGHIGHDARLGNQVILGAGGLIAGHVHVDDRAFVSGNAAIHQHCRMGRIAMLRGVAAVSMDIPPFCIADYRNSLRGLNVIGMQRAGLDGDTRMALKQAFKLLFRNGQPFGEAVREVEAGPLVEVPEVVELIEFVRSSTRGVVSWFNPQARDETNGQPLSDDEWLERPNLFTG